MPRAERPLDDEQTELGSFAADLRRLRDKAGKPSYRELASLAHYSAAALSDAAGGRKLPSLAVTLAYVNACGGDPGEWECRWRAIAAPPDRGGETPYVGLTAFQNEDADRFFGREQLTAKLVRLTRERPFVGVFGASGSGKSSLLRAGLVPRLDEALVFTPGVHPIDECAVRLSQLTGDSAVSLRAELADPAALGLRVKQHNADLVLVVDQFEEVFTLCGPEQRDWFVQALVAAPHVVIGVRADFYGHVGRHPELVEALEGAQLLVGPMTTDELRRAIVEPAHRADATVETALVTRLVADVAGQSAALPLVQHALVETWHRRRGMTLTLAGYEEAGGVEHAIARTAEAVFSGLTPEQQQTARGIFLRLIALGEGTEDTKRRAAREDLDADVLERLATARLVTVAEQHAELAHEALIQSWPRLRDWIAEDRDALRVHHQLTDAAAAWGGDRDLLYKGARLAQAGELNPDSLTEHERAFLEAGQADGRRRVRRVRVVVTVLSVLVVLLAGTVVFAVDRAAEVARQQVGLVANNAANTARRMIERDPETALRIALAAYHVAPGDETRDALLSADAATRTYARDSKDVYYNLLDNGYFTEMLGPDVQRTSLRVWRHTDTPAKPYMVLPGRPLSFSQDGKRLLMAVGFEIRAKMGVELLDTTDPAQPRRLAAVSSSLGYYTPLTRAGDAFAGRLARTPTPGNLDVTEDKARVWFYDGASGFREVVLPGADVSGSMALSADGKLLALFRRTTGRRTAELWRLDGAQPRLASSWQVDYGGSSRLTFSPDGTRLVMHNEKAGTTEVRDVSDPENLAMWAELPEREAGLFTVAFAEGGRYLGIATDRGVHVWDVGERGLVRRVAALGGYEPASTGLAYLPSRNAFATSVGGQSIWYLRIDIDEVVRDRCGDAYVRLSEEEWQRYFPDIERVPVC